MEQDFSWIEFRLKARKHVISHYTIVDETKHYWPNTKQFDTVFDEN